MTAAILLGGTFGLGLGLMVAAQPVGRRRPDLGARLARLSAHGRHQLDQEHAHEGSERVFLLPGLEATLRPLLEDLGRLPVGSRRGWAWTRTWSGAWRWAGRGLVQRSTTVRSSPPDWWA